MQPMLRADLSRQFQNLLALGWLGRAYQLFPWAVEAVWPSLFEFEAYDDSAAVLLEDGSIECTLKESSIIARGLPFHFRLKIDDNGEGKTKVTSAALLRIGCDLREPNASDHSAVDARVVFRATRAAKGALVDALVACIFDRLSPAADVLETGELKFEDVMKFTPRKGIWWRCLVFTALKGVIHCQLICLFSGR